MSQLFKLAMVFLIATTIAVAPARAAVKIWDDGAGDHNFVTPENWPGDAFPAAADDPVIQGGYFATLASATPNNVRHIYLGDSRSGATAGPGRLGQTGGSLTSTGVLYLGNSASSYGYYTLADGTATTAGIYPGYGNGAAGVVQQSGGTLTLTAGGIRIGTGSGSTSPGTGLFHQTGGAFDVVTLLSIGGGYSNCWGQANIGGTTTVAAAAYTALPRHAGSKGYLNLTAGGALTTPRVDVYATAAAGGEGFLNFHGGTLKANASTPNPEDPATHFIRRASGADGAFGIFVGAEGGTIDTDTFDIVISEPLRALTGSGLSGFTVTAGGAGFDGPPIVKIDQPDADADGQRGMGASAVANVDVVNGTLTDIAVTNPGSGYDPDDPVNVTLVGGDPSAPATFSVSLADNAVDGGLVKKGLGKLTLAGANTYVGLTDVQAGALALTGSLAGDVQVRGSAKLMGGGAVGDDLTALAGSIVAPGTSIGTLSITGDASLAGTLDVEYDSSANVIDVLAVGGQLDLSGGTIQFSDLAATPVALDQAAYVFATYGSLVGSLPAVVAGTLPAGYVVDFDYGGDSIALVLVPEPTALALLAALLMGVLMSRRRR